MLQISSNVCVCRGQRPEEDQGVSEPPQKKTKATHDAAADAEPSGSGHQSDIEIVEIEEMEEEEVLTGDECVEFFGEPTAVHDAQPKTEPTQLPSASVWEGWRVKFFDTERASKFQVPAQVRDPSTYGTSVPSFPKKQTNLHMYFDSCPNTTHGLQNPAGQEPESKHEAALDSADEGNAKKNIMKDHFFRGLGGGCGVRGAE